MTIEQEFYAAVKSGDAEQYAQAALAAMNAGYVIVDRVNLSATGKVQFNDENEPAYPENYYYHEEDDE